MIYFCICEEEKHRGWLVAVGRLFYILPCFLQDSRGRSIETMSFRLLKVSQEMLKQHANGCPKRSSGIALKKKKRHGECRM